MTQREITARTPLLDGRGQIAQPGWARRMNYIYNREQARRNPFNLKEWNFYQFIKGHWAVQLTIGHLSYACNAAVTLLDLDTGEKREEGRLRLLRALDLDRDPEGPSVTEYRDEGFLLRFEVGDNLRWLTFQGESRRWGAAEVRLEAENDPANEKMVIATPFAKPRQFYLNYKENYYRASGFARFGELEVGLDGASGLLDWGRGIWPYRHEWWWGSLSAVVDGAELGLNIGWGFGDLSHATENMFFYKRRAYKLGALRMVMEGGYMDPWHLTEEDGRMELRFQPIYDNYTERKLVVVDTSCHQVYGRFSGWAETDGGRVAFHDLPGFIEHAVNRW